uniref:NB-ARC domain-containing protein n=1 Tax=Kalanchoe fedtschenkoi TaxID=63787 RepID=A0A7N0RJ63_KALFE
MSLDVLQFLKEDFLHKYEKLQRSFSSIDAPIRKIFVEYYILLKSTDIASLQGADKDLLYVLNRAVDDCLVESAESLHSMAKRSFRRCKQTKTSQSRQELEDNLIKLKSAISRQSGSTVTAPHKPSSIPLLNYDVHGFQDQFDETVKKISPRSQGAAVGIVGIGGSGKTTLASMVFNSREVKEKYQIRIWASMTSTLNRTESSRGSVFMDILSGVQNSGSSLNTMFRKVEYHHGGGLKMADHVLDKYVQHFKETLKRNSNKYLIVLDDVWETQHWFAETEETKPILSREWIKNTGGTVMVTSRLEEMAENIVGKENLYAIKPVSGQACIDIFLARASKNGLETSQLRNLTKDVEKKCFGLPLAACTLADVIAAKRKEEAEADAANAKAAAEADALEKEKTDAAEHKAEEVGAAKAKTEAEEDGLKEEEEEEEAGAAKAKTEVELVAPERVADISR